MLFLLSPSPSNIFPKIIASFRRKEYLLGLEKVSFRVLESNFSIVATRLGCSAEPIQQVCRLQSAPLSSLVGIPCCRTTFCTLCYANKSSPVTCLVIFLAYILLYSPYGVMKVGMRVLLVLVTFLNMLRRCMRWASYALLISYSP